jgi:hypothetical protein
MHQGGPSNNHVYNFGSERGPYNSSVFNSHLGGGYNNGSFIWGRIELERIFNIELGRIINEPGVPQSALAVQIRSSIEARFLEIQT